jgi:hypothetical protein
VHSNGEAAMTGGAVPGEEPGEGKGNLAERIRALQSRVSRVSPPKPN